MSEAVTGSRPPPSLQADHDRLIAVLEDQSPGPTLAASIDNDDLVGATAVRMNFLIGVFRAARQSSAAFCRSLVSQDPDRTCDGDVPGGEYGVALRDLFNRSSVEFFPRVTGFPLGLSEDELFASHLVINPAIEEFLAEALAEVRSLTPPPELSADHAVIERYLADIGETARGITQSAHDRDS